MGHLETGDGYHALSGRLNRSPQGAAPSELLYAILRLLFSEREAELVAQVPIRPFDAATAARISTHYRPTCRRASRSLQLEGGLRSC